MVVGVRGGTAVAMGRWVGTTGWCKAEPCKQSPPSGALQAEPSKGENKYPHTPPPREDLLYVEAENKGNRNEPVVLGKIGNPAVKDHSRCVAESISLRQRDELRCVPATP